MRAGRKGYLFAITVHARLISVLAVRAHEMVARAAYVLDAVPFMHG